MTPGASVGDGVSIDASWQYWDERPAAQDDGDELDQEAEDVLYATDPEVDGEVRAENVPVPDGGQRPEDADGQTTLDEWGWSA